MLNYQRYYNVRKRLRKRSYRNINFHEITLIASPFGYNSYKSVTVLPTLSSEHASNTHAYHHLS